MRFLLCFASVLFLNVSASQAIISGQKVAPTDPIFNSTVMLLTQDKKTHSIVICSGVLIARNWILTAAHCLADGFKSAHFGVDNSLGDFSVVKNEIIAPGYVNGAENDLMLVEIHQPAPDYMIPAILIENEDQINKYTGTFLTAGYGSTSLEANDSGRTLNKSITYIQNYSYLTDSILVNGQGSGACIGDSGGPGYWIENNEVYLWGLDSRSPDFAAAGCGDLEVYTSIPKHTQWIKSIIAK